MQDKDYANEGYSDYQNQKPRNIGNHIKNRLSTERNRIKNKRKRKNAIKKKQQEKKKAEKKAKRIQRIANFIKFVLLTTTGKVIFVVLIVLFVGLIIYICTNSFDNTDGASRNYQTYARNYTTSEAAATTDSNGRIVRTGYVSSLSPQNAAIESFYKMLSKQSFYQISVDDDTTLIRSDNPDFKKDYYNREQYMQLNPDFIYALDNTMFNGKTVYPEQFIKPVAYDKNTMKLQNLIDEDGNLAVTENIDGQEKIQRNLSDFGFASVLKYQKDYEVHTRKWRFYRQEVWDVDSQSVQVQNIDERGEEETSRIDIQVIKNIASFCGTVTYNYEPEETKQSGIVMGATSSARNDTSEMWVYETYVRHLYVGTKIIITDEPEKDENGHDKVDEDGNIIYKTITQTDEGEYDYLIGKGYLADEITRKRDRNGNPVDETYQLRKFKDADYSGDYMTVPIVRRQGGVETEDANRNYYKAYLEHFTNIKIPIDNRSYDELVNLETVGSENAYNNPSENQSSGSQLSSANQTSRQNISESHQAFIQVIANLAVEDYKESGILPSITMAQCILESGWGRSSIGNNYFGIKAGSSWTGKRITTGTKEDYGNGKVSITADFRDYDSPEEGLRDHSKLLWNPRYSGIPGNTDYRQVANLLQSCGYATDRSYATQLIGIIERYGLNQYDTVASWSGQTPEYAQGNGNSGNGSGGGNTSSAGATPNSEQGLASVYGNELSEEDKRTYYAFVNKYSNLNENTEYIEYSFNARDNDLDNIIITTENFNNGSFKDEVEPAEISFWDKTYIGLSQEGSVMGSLGIELDNQNLIGTTSSYQNMVTNLPSVQGYSVPIARDIIITSPFSNYRVLHENGVNSEGSHNGTDIAGSTSDDILSVSSGTIITIRPNSPSAGNYVEVQNDDNTVSRYLHMSAFAPNISVGQRITNGTVLGKVGSTGQSTGPHLHIGWVVNGQPTDFYPVLQQIYAAAGYQISVR